MAQLSFGVTAKSANGSRGGEPLRIVFHRKSVVATARRRERVYKRTAEPSVPICEEEAQRSDREAIFQIAARDTQLAPTSGLSGKGKAFLFVAVAGKRKACAPITSSVCFAATPQFAVPKKTFSHSPARFFRPLHQSPVRFSRHRRRERVFALKGKAYRKRFAKRLPLRGEAVTAGD